MGEERGTFRAIIVGAGPAGLLTAQALQKQGINCTVFEQDASLAARPRDWNFGIYWAQVPLDQCLPDDLNRLVESAQVDSRTPTADDFMPIYNGQSGELMKKVPAPYNIRLHRRKFLKLISTGIDIRYGKVLDHIETDGTLATAIFKDGTREVGNLLIGAEGAHSRVRNFLLGADKAALQMSPIVGTGTIAKLPAETALQFKELHPRYLITFHPNGSFVWIGVHEGYDDLKPGEWTFMMLQSWISEHDLPDLKGPKILEDFKDRAKLYGEPFNTILRSIPEDTRCWHNRLSYWPTETWDNRNGTVTLVGDAAHPMTYHRGQGLNNAIHDAAVLGQELKKRSVASQSDVSSAVTAYEREMWPRGKEAVMSSNQNSLSTHNWSTLLNSPLFTAGLKQKVVPEDSKSGE